MKHLQSFKWLPFSLRLRQTNLLLPLPLLLPLLLFLFSCGSAETPLDADTRKAIDSISIVRIQVERARLDSTCRQARVNMMPHWVDSLRQVRLSEIEKQLKTIPR